MSSDKIYEEILLLLAAVAVLPEDESGNSDGEILGEISCIA